MRCALLFGLIAGLAAATPAQARLFEVEEVERPAPPELRARAQVLEENVGVAVRPVLAAPIGIDHLRMVNDAVNARPYVDDLANYGVPDHWATTADFAARGGDCEDFAAAKYVALKALGVPADAMRVVMVRDMMLGTAHAVLDVDLGDGRYILDNQSPDVLPDSAVDRYEPVYAINEASWWLFVPKL